MIINIPKSPITDANGNLSQEWLIFFNQLVRTINELEKAGQVIPP